MAVLESATPNLNDAIAIETHSYGYVTNGYFKYHVSELALLCNLYSVDEEYTATAGQMTTGQTLAGRTIN
eukprot:2943100-Amphidinium_carterae.1